MKAVCDISVTSAPCRPRTWTPTALFASGATGAWYDPSDLTTLFQDAAGTIAVTAPDQPVGYIADKSGFGHHAVQSSDARRPTYRTDGTFHWLEFDGVDDFLQIANTLSLNTGTVAMALAEPTGRTTFSHILGRAGTPGYLAMAGAGAARSLHKNAGNLYPVDTPGYFPMTARSAVGIRIQNGYVFARRWPDTTEYTNSYECSPGLNATNILMAFSPAGELSARMDLYGMCLIESAVVANDYDRALTYFNGKIAT